MTEATLDLHKSKALELANAHPATPDEIVKRAVAYHAFLSGTTAAPKATAAPAAPKAGAPGTSTTPKAPAAPKAGAAPKAPAAPKAGAAPKAPAAAPKADAKAGASAQPVAADTKAPGGTYTYADVVAKLREVQGNAGLGRDKAFEILAAKGGGVKSVRDLKPTAYDAVVEGCDAALNEGDPPEHTGGGTEVEDPTATPELDDLGMPVG